MARSLTTSFSTFALLAALGLAAGGANAQDSLTVVSWGGAYGAAQQKHVIDPYQKDSGVKVLFEDYSGGVAEIKAQVESGNIQWDVVDFEVIDLERACSEGLLESLDHSTLPPGIQQHRKNSPGRRYHARSFPLPHVRAAATLLRKDRFQRRFGARLCHLRL